MSSTIAGRLRLPDERHSGGNENINGVLRQYLPRHLDLRTFSQADLDAIADELNGRPRQALGFRSPSEALHEVLR